MQSQVSRVEFAADAEIADSVVFDMGNPHHQGLPSDLERAGSARANDHGSTITADCFKLRQITET